MNIDEDDFELDGPISRDKENDPFELILMGYKTWMSKIDTSDGVNFEQIQANYQNAFTLRHSATSHEKLKSHHQVSPHYLTVQFGPSAKMITDIRMK